MRCTAVIVYIAIACGVVFQPIQRTMGTVVFDHNQTALLVELLGKIKDAIQTGHFGDRTEAYKSVSLRLGSCAVTFSMSSEIEKSSPSLTEQYRDASNLFFRMASAIYPGDEKALSHDIKNSDQFLWKLRSDRRAMFNFLRNCRDFLQPDMVPAAVNELLLH